MLFLNTHMQKNNFKKFGGHWVQIEYVLESLRMQIRKKWLNQLKNILTNIIKNII
jgi:hypothetical protein